MDVMKYCLDLLDIRSFRREFQINKFKESPDFVDDFCTSRICNGIYLNVQGKGRLPENKDYVVFRNWRYQNDTKFGVAPRKLICTCTVNILDAKGRKKFPRTFGFSTGKASLDQCLSDRWFEERYVERSFILNNASEYLQDNVLTVTVEGTVEEWGISDWTLIHYWSHEPNSANFHVEEHELGLEVYLLETSHHAKFLKIHSTIFRDMWSSPMPESSEARFLLRNEELPAFLCMLVCIETRRLISLHSVTVFDVYKLAHMYDIPIVLEKCREDIIKNYLSECASEVLKFAVYYDDEELERYAKYYPDGYAQEHNQNFENRQFTCDTRPVFSNSINTKRDFERYIRSLWRTLERITGFETWTRDESFDFYR